MSTNLKQSIQNRHPILLVPDFPMYSSLTAVVAVIPTDDRIGESIEKDSTFLDFRLFASNHSSPQADQGGAQKQLANLKLGIALAFDCELSTVN